MKNNEQNEMYDENSVASILWVANLQTLVDGFGPLIGLAATLPKDQREPLVRSGIESKFGPEVENNAIEATTGAAKADQAKAVVNQLMDQKAGTPRRIPLSDPRTCLPSGLDCFIFLACITLAVLVTICDGANASLLAARYLQSALAGLAFLVPSLCAPLVAKAGLSRLPDRARYWAELFLGLAGIGTAAFFVYQFVSVFTATQSPDAVTDGIPGIKFVYLATLTLGFCVVYFLMAKALSMIRPGPSDQENPDYQKLAVQLVSAEQSLSAATANVVSLQPRLTKISTYKEYTFRFVMAACEAKMNAVRSEEEAAEAKAKARADGAQRDWSQFSKVLGQMNGDSTNGHVSPSRFNP